MTRDEQVLRTTIKVEIELTGIQVRALQRVKNEHMMDVSDTNYDAGILITEISNVYDDHFDNNLIRPDWDDGTEDSQ
tara:strand:- start:96 stop:326 length:231 start_codon:yes stop_codon:yes gene_type:complete